MQRIVSEFRNGHASGWLPLVAGVCLAGAVWSDAAGRLLAQEKAGPQSRVEAKRGGISTERVEVVLAFAREHHPELSDLLVRLEMTDTQQFQRAIHDLNKDVERLTKLKEKSSRQYDLAIRKWRCDSRIRLIMARLSMAESPELEAELRAAVAERVELREQELREEQALLRKRIEANVKQLKPYAEGRDKVIDDELSMLRKTAGGSRERIKALQQAARKAKEKAASKAGTTAVDGAASKPGSQAASRDKSDKRSSEKSSKPTARSDGEPKEVGKKDVEK